MNTIEDEKAGGANEDVEAGNLVHRRRRRAVQQEQIQVINLEPEALSVGLIDKTLQSTNADADEAVPKHGHRSLTGLEFGRNRGSPARLYKVNQELSPEQVSLIKGKQFGGLLNIAQNMPNEFSKWVLGCCDHQTSNLVVPEKGRIAVIAESVYRNFRLPNSGKEVIYERNQEAVDFVNKEYGLVGKKAPEITVWCKMIKDMKGKADDKSCLLILSTSLQVSPRCYANFINLEDVGNINFCQFVVDEIKAAFMKLGDKNSVKCCVYHLLILCLDNLVTDEVVSSCPVHAEAWRT